MLKTDPTQNGFYECSDNLFFLINEKVPVVESLFSEVTGEIYALSNYFENSNTCIGIFRKAALLKILRSSLLTGVARLQSYSQAYSLNS